MADIDGSYESGSSDTWLVSYNANFAGHDGSIAPWDIVASSGVLPPEITNISPAPDTSISRTQTITFTAQDPEGAAVIFAPIWVLYSASREPVYDGVEFFPPFATSSTATPNGSGGIDFSITRDGEWPEPPTFRCRPVDAAGNL